ncbi:crystallin, alpha B, b [Aplochiton taeniatus]
MDVPVQYPWYRRAFSSQRMADLHPGDSFSDWSLTWPFPWALPWIRPNYLRWLNWPENGHAEMRADKDCFVLNLDVKHFSPEELTVNICEDLITVHGKHDDRQDDHGFVSREFLRKYKLPASVAAADVTSSLSGDGVLTVTAPRSFSGPERTIPIIRDEGSAAQKM